MTSVSVDFAIAALGAVTGANGYPFNGNVDAINVFLVYDRQSNGAAPAFTDIYNGSGSALAPFGHRNVNNLERFEVLKKGTYKIDSASNNMIRDSWYLPMHHETRYNGGNAGTIADIQTGSIYLVFVDQNTAVVGAASMAADVDCRVRFHDM